MGKKYRKAVVGVFVNTSNEVLTLERSDFSGSWQLPQGGVDEGETLEDAVKREMFEELRTTRNEWVTGSMSEMPSSRLRISLVLFS